MFCLRTYQVLISCLGVNNFFSTLFIYILLKKIKKLYNYIFILIFNIKEIKIYFK